MTILRRLGAELRDLSAALRWRLLKVLIARRIIQPVYVRARDPRH